MTNEVRELNLPVNVVLLMYRAGKNSAQIVQSLTGLSDGQPHFATQQQAVKKLLATAFPQTFQEPMEQNAAARVQQPE